MLFRSQGKLSKIYIISDTHIGGEGGLNSFEAESELIAFLKEISKEKKAGETKELILAGDFLNLWEIESRKELEKLKFIIKTHKKIFSAFSEAAKKITITAIPGNHDQELSFVKGYKEELEKWGISLICEEFIVRFLGGKKIRIEHGHRFDPFNKIADFKNPASTSYGYHISKNIFLKIARVAKKNKKNNFWLKDLICFQPINLGFSWFFSNYFYRELAPLLRYFVSFFLVMTSFSLVLLLWAIGTRLGIVAVPSVFYFTHLLGPIRYLANFIIILSFVFIFFLLGFYLIFRLTRRDLLKNLKDYGITSTGIWAEKRESSYYQRVKRFLNKNLDIDILVLGHSHTPKIMELKSRGKIFVVADSGSWLKAFRPVRSWFRLPNVYLSFFDLSYLEIKKQKGSVAIFLKFKSKMAKTSLTFLEKFSIMFKNRDQKTTNQAFFIKKQ
jgi:UDP-2,3-diacylglucosamine pyrophosphatase LpxH